MASAVRQFFFAQKAFIWHRDRLLLVRKSMDDPNHPGKWEVPGGRMEFGEEVDDHLAREVREEVGLAVRAGPPFHVWQWRLKRAGTLGGETDIQIVAVARICWAASDQISDAGRVSEDYLGEARWVRLQDISQFELIPNMVPAMREFCTKVRELDTPC